MKRWLRTLASICLAGSTALAADWPQFRGPNRDGKCTETGLLQEWPEGGPRLLWQMNGMGTGFASLAIVGDKAYTMGDRGDDQFVIAIDLKERREIWATKIGPKWTQSNDPGSRGTPTVDGALMYVLGAHGDLVCLDTASGKIVWQKSLPRDFGGKMMSGWGWSESPTVDGDKVLICPGTRETAMVALNKKTGQMLWKTAIPDLGPKGKDGAGYASIVIAEIGGVRQYITVLGKGAIGVAASDGKFLWGHNSAVNSVANITCPVVKDNLVFYTSSYRTGSALVRLTPNPDGTFKAEQVYFIDADAFNNHHGGVVLVGDHIYGGSGQNQGIPVCLEMQTGKVAWKDRAPAEGSAAILYADGNILFRYQKGGLVTLVQATPEGYKVRGRLTPAFSDRTPAWSHPVIADGKLYLRHQDVLMCYDVKK